MRRLPIGVHAVLLGLALTATATTAYAQDAGRGEFSAGWKLLHVMEVVDDEGETLSKGWYADGSFNLTRAVAVVGEVAGAYKTFEESDTEFGVPINVSANLKIHTVLGGLRVSRRTPRATPFAQVLFGVAHGSIDVEGSATVAGRTFTVSESESSNEFALDIGGGVNLMVADGVGVRVSASYIRIGASDGGNGFRFGAGVVLPF